MSGPILRALGVLNDRLIHAEAIGEALDLAGGDEAPAWVHVYCGQVATILEASEALETLLRGDGGCAPHGDDLSTCTDLLRGQPGALPGSRSCPEKPSSKASQ